MTKLTRAELNRRVTVQASTLGMDKPGRQGLTPAQTEDVINALCQVIEHTLLQGDEVVLPGIGKLAAQEAAARHHRNPRTGEVLLKPAHRKPKMTFSKPLRDRLAG